MTAKRLWRNELVAGGESVLIPWITTLSRPPGPALARDRRSVREPPHFSYVLAYAVQGRSRGAGARGSPREAREPALHLPLGFLDGGCGRAGEAVFTNRPDPPHDPTQFLFATSPITHMAKALDILETSGKKYFIDERLHELRNTDNPHEVISFPDEESFRQYVEKSSNLRLRRFRAKVESADWLEVDFFAHDLSEAEIKAKSLDGGLFKLKRSDWEITDVEEVPADKPFDPID